MTSSRKTFVGRILGVTQSSVVMSVQDGSIGLAAGAVTLEQARTMLGQTVRYSVDVASETQCLSNPKFVIGSEFGIQAATPAAALHVTVTWHDRRGLTGW